MPKAIQVPAAPPRCCRRILLVLDEAALVRALAFGLRQAGHQVAIQPDPKMLADDVMAGRVDLVVLEPALLPLDDAIALCAAFQRRGGVWLALIARQPDEYSELALLRAGGDRYLQLPMAPTLLLAHLLAVLRRPPPPLGDGLRPVTALWSLDERARRLVGSNRLQRLSELEYRLLVTFLDRPGAVLGRPALLAAVWGEGYSNGREVDQYVYYLRHKVEVDPAHPRVVVTVGRTGYQYRPPERTLA